MAEVGRSRAERESERAKQRERQREQKRERDRAGLWRIRSRGFGNLRGFARFLLPTPLSRGPGVKLRCEVLVWDRPSGHTPRYQSTLFLPVHSQRPRRGTRAGLAGEISALPPPTWGGFFLFFFCFVFFNGFFTTSCSIQILCWSDICTDWDQECQSSAAESWPVMVIII